MNATGAEPIASISVQDSCGGRTVEIGDGVDHRLRLVALRAVAAVGELEQPARWADPGGNAVELLHRAVLVVVALDREHRAANLRQLGLDVPVAELRIEPAVVPAEKGAVGIVVHAGQRLPELAVLPCLARDADALDRHVLDEDMRRHDRDRARSVARGVEQRDRPAVAVADEQRRVDAEFREQGRQHDPRLAMEIVGAAPLRERRRAAVAAARIDEAGRGEPVAHGARKIAPARDRAQPFVQEDERRGAAFRRDAEDLEPLVGDLDESDRHAARGIRRRTSGRTRRAGCAPKRRALNASRIFSIPAATAHVAIAHTNPSRPAAGCAISSRPNSTDTPPSSHSSHSRSISARNLMPAQIISTPAAMA